MSLRLAISSSSPSRLRRYLSVVMPGPVPGIHVLLRVHAQDVDGRDKPGHDGATPQSPSHIHPPPPSASRPLRR
ncbi:MAG: hypothetical protein GEU91_15385 [Rhizobiales bacterium]|nr:hypothetical protein [Hyphomicrobiales bacterium]